MKTKLITSILLLTLLCHAHSTYAVENSYLRPVAEWERGRPWATEIKTLLKEAYENIQTHQLDKAEAALAMAYKIFTDYPNAPNVATKAAYIIREYIKLTSFAKKFDGLLSFFQDKYKRNSECVVANTVLAHFNLQIEKQVAAEYHANSPSERGHPLR